MTAYESTRGRESEFSTEATGASRTLGLVLKDVEISKLDVIFAAVREAGGSIGWAEFPQPGMMIRLIQVPMERGRR